MELTPETTRTTTNGRPGAVIIGSDFQALGVIRSLVEHNVPMFLVEFEPNISRFSRYINRRVAKYDFFQDPGIVEFLLQLADKHSLDGWVLFANNDETVKLLAQNHERLSQRFQVSVPPWEVSQSFYCKDKAYKLAADNGIVTPKIYPATELDQLLASDIEFPIVLKPAFKENYYDKTRKKAVLCRDRNELAREYASMRRLIPSSQIVVQEFITGGPRNLYSYACVFDGQQIVAGMAARRLRQHPMDFGHATTYAESVALPELADLTQRLLSAMHYRGVAEVEFMYDEKSGHYKFIEMNGRIWGWHTLAKAAGVNMSYALYCLMVNEPIPPTNGLVDAKWIRAITDTPTSAREWFHGRLSLTTYLQSFRGERVEFAVWSRKDPLPFLMEIAMLPYLWWKKGF
jgi:predicted ATP-grasp superfamily ATP-dependent carboligase